MKKFIGVVCILIVGFACGFYLSGAQVFSSFNTDNTNTKQSAPLPASTDKTSSGSEITEDEARVIALHDANVDLNAIYNLRVHAENYYGIDIYDVEFDTNDKEYNYNIDRQSGAVIAMDYEIDERYLRDVPGKFISQQEAVDLAVQNIPGAKAADIQIRQGHDDHYAEYEGRAVVDNTRYEFTINADKGLITEWEVDRKTR